MSGSFFIILLAMLGFMYLLLIRPQRRRQREQERMLQNLRVGDEVLTVGGIYGDVTAVEDDRVSLLIADEVEVEVSRRAIASVVPDDGEELAGEEMAEAEEPEEPKLLR